MYINMYILYYIHIHLSGQSVPDRRARIRLIHSTRNNDYQSEANSHIIHIPYATEPRLLDETSSATTCIQFQASQLRNKLFIV